MMKYTEVQYYYYYYSTINILNSSTPSYYYYCITFLCIIQYSYTMEVLI